MNSQMHFRPLLKQIQSEHRQLHQMLGALVNLAEQDGKGAMHRDHAVLKWALEDLRVQLVNHFEKEEAGGLFDEALILAPRRAAEGTAIQRDHRQLLSELSSLTDHIPGGEPTLSQWRQIEADIQQFKTHMLDHEAAENRLLAACFNVDLESE